MGQFVPSFAYFLRNFGYHGPRLIHGYLLVETRPVPEELVKEQEFQLDALIGRYQDSLFQEVDLLMSCHFIYFRKQISETSEVISKV